MLTPEEWSAIGLSLKVATVAMIASLPFGIAVALVLARREFWGKTLLDGIVHLPLVLPPVVTGYVLLILFGRKGPIGAFLDQTVGLVFAFRWTGAALASAVMGFPLMVRAIRLAVEAIDPRLEGAAASLGAGRAAVLLTVTLPLAAPGILAGGARLRQGARRVRRDHHLRLQHPRRDPDHRLGDLQRDAEPVRRRRGAAPDPVRDRARPPRLVASEWLARRARQAAR